MQILQHYHYNQHKKQDCQPGNGNVEIANLLLVSPQLDSLPSAPGQEVDAAQYQDDDYDALEKPRGIQPRQKETKADRDAARDRPTKSALIIHFTRGYNLNIEIESMAIELPRVAGHPNRLPFRGVLTLLDVASDKPPAGAKGHRVMLTRAAAERALPSLLGMALDFTPNLDGHDARRKVGVITSAEILPVAPLRGASPDGGVRRRTTAAGAYQLEIAGYIFARDFPDVVEKMRSGDELGMSYEIANARVADANAAVWILTDATFTGAAMLLRSKAAYPSTWIELDSQHQLSQ